VEAHLSLGADLAELEPARRFVADTLTAWDRGRDLDTALLLVSELVTNSVVHAETEVGLTLRGEGSQIRVEVADHSDKMPVDLDVPPTALSGRGIHLVATMSEDWGVRTVPGDGKVIWFALAS
jgi:anti-sigma regulatory factor (Ser/Thr protein kinase)